MGTCNLRDKKMNIKSLLLGSAAAVVAVSGAQAADAIVVEPEPVEYVRICDAYGSGFFYIPGTETCIRFGGYVRSSYEKGYFDRDVHDQVQITAGAPAVSTGGTNVVVAPATAVGGGTFELEFWGQRARLDIDTRNETDWGTLRAQYRLEGGDSNTDADIDMDRALISLAGFRFGFTDNYWTTNHGYAAVNFTGLGAIAWTQDDGFYGFNDATMADYTWAADGFAVTVGVEDPRIDYAAVGVVTTNFNGAATDTNAFANFYAGVNYSADWGSLAFTAVHDSGAVDNGLGAAQDNGGWAYKASITLDISEWVPGGVLHGKYMADGDYRTNYVHTNGALLDASHVWQVSYQMDLTDELQMMAQYSHADGDDLEGAANAVLANHTEEGDAWIASVGLNWFPAAAPGFSVRGSYKWGEANDALRASATNLAIVDEEFHGFFIGVRRDF